VPLDLAGLTAAKPVLILGAGWVGSRLATELLGDGTRVIVTHRPGFNAKTKPPYFRPLPLDLPPESSLEFDLSEPATWDALPKPDSLSAVVITFPLAAGPEAFWDFYLSRVPNVLCLSSTSVYQV
jgi:S-adenosylhomocysteine hydrolase